MMVINMAKLAWWFAANRYWLPEDVLRKLGDYAADRLPRHCRQKASSLLLWRMIVNWNRGIRQSLSQLGRTVLTYSLFMSVWKDSDQDRAVHQRIMRLVQTCNITSAIYRLLDKFCIKSGQLTIYTVWSGKFTIRSQVCDENCRLKDNIDGVCWIKHNLAPFTRWGRIAERLMRLSVGFDFMNCRIWLTFQRHWCETQDCEAATIWGCWRAGSTSARMFSSAQSQHFLDIEKLQENLR